MRPTFRTLLGTAAVLASVVTAPAHATPAFATATAGDCSVTLAADPTAEPGTMSGELAGSGAPAPSGAPGSGTLSCSVVVGTGRLPGTGGVVSGHGTAVATAGPSVVAVNAGNQSVYLCESYTADGDGIEYYWDAIGRTWSTDPSVGCEPVIAGTAVETPNVPPQAPATADCPYGAVTGDIAYVTPVTTVTARVAWTMHLHADCVGSGVAGHYEMTFAGQSDESCVSGTGGATVTGTGPNGPLTGTWSFTRGGIHYYGYAPLGSGHFTDATGGHQMAWWLDVFADGDTPCPIATGHIVGHGLLTL